MNMKEFYKSHTRVESMSLGALPDELNELITVLLDIRSQYPNNTVIIETDDGGYTVAEIYEPRL
jgi:hypothetical protein